MNLKTIINYASNKIKPFSLKEIIIAGSIALTLGAGVGYFTYRQYNIKELHSIEQKIDTEAAKKEQEQLEDLKDKVNNLENTLSELELKYKKQNSRKNKPIINYMPNKRANSNQGDTPRIRRNYSPRPAVQTGQTSETANDTPIQGLVGRKDGYNLVAYFFPEGTHARPNEKLNVKTYGNDADGDFLTINIPTLGTPAANQILKIGLDDNTEFFTETPSIFLKDINGNNLNLDEYLNISYGTLNNLNQNSINISPKGLQASAYLKNGTKLLIETKIRNKYGAIENETMEIIIGGRQ